MSDTLLDLSGKVDQLSLQLYDSLTQVATSCGIQFYVVGARARDMILVHGYGREITRATMDINLGIRVSNWDEFNKLRDTLLQSKDFTPTKEIQRLLYMEELPVDILPFGIIEQGDRNISWPPEPQHCDECTWVRGGLEGGANGKNQVRTSHCIFVVRRWLV